MNLEAINKWLDEEYGCSYTRLEELHDFYFENYCDLKKENNQLKEELKYTVPIVEHNKIVSKKLKENKKYKEVIDELNDLLIIKKARCLNEDNYVLNVPDLDDILQVLKEVE